MEENKSVFDLQVDETSSRSLWSAAGWARFISITALICLVLFLAIVFAFRDNMMDSMSRLIPGLESSQTYGFLLAAIVFVIIICIVLVIFLLRGATLVRRGILAKNQQTFNSGLASFKAYFTMLGIIFIIGILLNLMSFIR